MLRNDLFHSGYHEISELWSYDALQAALDILDAIEAAESFRAAEREAARASRAR